jgi:hypothetical protein
MLSDRAFYYAKGKAWHFAVLGLALAGFLTLAYLRAIENGRVSFASIVPFLVLVPMAAFAFRGNYDRRPVLTISAEGVWFSTWNISAPLSWASVISVKEIGGGRGLPFISLRTEGERSLPSGRLATHSLRVTALDIRHQDALRLIAEYWQSARSGNFSD